MENRTCDYEATKRKQTMTENDTHENRTDHTVEIDVEPLGGESGTVELSPGDEQTFSEGTVAFTVRVLDTEANRGDG